MQRVLKFGCFLAAFALLVVFTVGNVEAGALAGKKIFVDLKTQDDADDGDKVNDGVTTTAPVDSGGVIKVELFVEDGGGNGTIGYEIKFINTDNAFDSKWTITGAEAIGALSVLGAPGTDNVAPGGLSPETIPDNHYIGTITLEAKAAIAEGDSIRLVDTSIGVGTSLLNVEQDELDESDALITFMTPAGPSLSADKLIEVIPATGGAVSGSITITAENFDEGATITWSVTKVEGDSDIDSTVDGAQVVVKATGKGGAVADVYATSGEGDALASTDTLRITFTQANPAELASFGGELVDSRVVLNWTTASQTNNAGWRMLRSVDGETYEVVGSFIQGAGTSDALLAYRFEDSDLPNTEKVFYILEQVDLDGSIARSQSIEVILGSLVDLPSEFATNVYPNPFNPSTTISYDLPEAGFVSIRIYDALGQEIRFLESRQAAAGRYKIQWDARDNQGRGVASGVYIAKVEAGSFSAAMKMLLLK